MRSFAIDNARVQVQVHDIIEHDASTTCIAQIDVIDNSGQSNAENYDITINRQGLHIADIVQSGQWLGFCDYPSKLNIELALLRYLKILYKKPL